MRLASTYLLAICAIFFGADIRAADKPLDKAKVIAVAEKAGAKVSELSKEDPVKLKLVLPKWDAVKMAPLKASPLVVQLIVEDAAKVNDSAMTLIAGFPNLENLQLFKPNLTPAALTPLKNHKAIKNLTINEAKIGDKAIIALKDLDQLVELDLNGCLITDAAATTFLDLPNLEILIVSNTKFTGKGMLQLKTMSKLKDLQVINCDVTIEQAMELEKSIKKIRIRR